MSVPVLERDAPAPAPDGVGQTLAHAWAAPQRRARAAAVRRAWTAAEERLLREQYPVRGGAACAQMLGRPLGSIYSKARDLELMGRPADYSERAAKIRRVPQTPELDMAIVAGYANASRRGDIKALARRLNVPYAWLSRRAALLGCGRDRHHPIGGWCAKERSILEACASRSAAYIASKLRAAGFVRTPTAVGLMLNQMRLDRSDPNAWCAHELAHLMGVSGDTVGRWVAQHGLRAEHLPRGRHGVFRITRRNLRAWLRDPANAARFDLRRVDQPWFLDVVLYGEPNR